ncbi:sugar isomerase domain-containing protein [Saccharopolyspora sp. NFXS83]|uniref:sugar isomerase domain-containing protein n=1 Tax=Saccharopolyspora sp. NFXS83 TaxID=2993560 RepID=UPI00224B668C|nr:sugar isomerase domain-containing protein [Saccharopolyspora sp. NFXS83]MCX2734106.1 sugar isomerase domain-containing protein [Saccharopolyspora sp. NFXS83]
MPDNPDTGRTDTAAPAPPAPAPTPAVTGPHHAEPTLAHLRKIGEHNVAALHDAARALIGCVREDGLVFTAGAGHSLAGVMESFYRAGGLAAVRPLYHPDLLPLHGAVASTATERTSGLAARVLDEAAFRGGRDALVVFSNSGVNPYPVELAATASAAGSTVIAVTSPLASADAPLRAGTTLAAQAGIVLDTLVPGGDASYPPAAPVTAPLSSLANAYLWNMLLVELHDAAQREGVELPVWRSANTIGGDEANKANLAHYGARVPGLT